MEQQEQKAAHNPNGELRMIFSEFLAEVVKLEELVEVGRRFLVCFQQAIEFLRRPSIHETSDLVQSILKANDTKRVNSYVQAGCVNVYDSTKSITTMTTSVSGLQDHLIKAKGIITELENLMEKAGAALPAAAENSAVQLETDISQGSEQDASASDSEEIALPSSGNFDAADCASFMAVIYSMVKQDYVMQERIVTSLSLKSTTGELDGYCLMWSLRPYVHDDIIHQALRLVR